MKRLRFKVEAAVLAALVAFGSLWFGLRYFHHVHETVSGPQVYKVELRVLDPRSMDIVVRDVESDTDWAFCMTRTDNPSVYCYKKVGEKLVSLDDGTPLKLTLYQSEEVSGN